MTNLMPSTIQLLILLFLPDKNLHVLTYIETDYLKYCAVEKFYIDAREINRTPLCNWLLHLPTKDTSQNYTENRSHLTPVLYWLVTSKSAAVLCSSSLCH